MKPKTTPFRHSSQQSNTRGGFSLVEIVLAMGIMAFGLIPLLALMPIGLTVHRQAIESTVSSQIVARVTHAAQQAEYSNLPDSSNPLTYCFDDQGNLLASGSNANLFSTCTDSKRLYDVRATVNKLAPLPASSGAAGTSTANSPSLARIQIDIASNPGRSSDIFNTTVKTAFVTYFSFVSKND